MRSTHELRSLGHGSSPVTGGENFLTEMKTKLNCERHLVERSATATASSNARGQEESRLDMTKCPCPYPHLMHVIMPLP